MKVSFDITKLWQSKVKLTSHKTKEIHSAHSKRQASKDSWDMSPEDALRVPYSGYK